MGPDSFRNSRPMAHAEPPTKFGWREQAALPVGLFALPVLSLSVLSLVAMSAAVTRYYHHRPGCQVSQSQPHKDTLDYQPPVLGVVEPATTTTDYTTDSPALMPLIPHQAGEVQ